MKRLLIVLFFVIPALTNGQYTYGLLQEMFFGRHPSARAESLGRAYCSIDGDLASVFYNPAGTATLKGLEMNNSFASPYYLAEKAIYSFLSLGYNVNKYLSVGVSRNHFSYGQEVSVIDGGGILTDEYIPENTNYTLNVSSQPIRNLLIGLNANYFMWKRAGLSTYTVYFDFGIIKKFQFAEKEFTHQSINIGTSITNLNFAKLKQDFYGNKINEELPVITRFGANYQFFLNKSWITDSLNTLRVLLQGDYQVLLNSKYYSGYYTGLELELLEILSIRLGYYKEYHREFYVLSSNHDFRSFTYGLGLQIPLHKLTRVPLQFRFDFTSLPQVSYVANKTWDNFSTYTLRINWMIGKEQK